MVSVVEAAQTPNVQSKFLYSVPPFYQTNPFFSFLLKSLVCTGSLLWFMAFFIVARGLSLVAHMEDSLVLAHGLNNYHVSWVLGLSS